MDYLILIVLGLIILGTIIAYVVKLVKNKPVPNSTPTPIPPNPTSPPVDPHKIYESFLQQVETVIRNNLTEEEVRIYLKSVDTRIKRYSEEPGFMTDFNKLLEKYNIPPINL